MINVAVQMGPTYQALNNTATAMREAAAIPMTFLFLWNCKSLSHRHRLTPHTGPTDFSPKAERQKKWPYLLEGFGQVTWFHLQQVA